MEAKVSHLQLIQAVITRMGSNSFLLKGWSVTLVAALFALAAAKTELRFVLLAYFPAIAFWLLDGYFLHQERLYRAVYDYVRQRDATEVDFSMDTSPFLGQVDSWSTVCFSKTLRLFHGAIIGTIIVVMVIIL